MTTCIVKVRDMRSPVMNQDRGIRVVVAIPNMAGHRPFSKDPAPSFDKPYFICEFGDYGNEDDFWKARPRIESTLKEMGYTTIQW